MRRTLAIVVLVLAAAFAVAHFARQRRGAAEAPREATSTLSEEEKAEITRFWAVYREAARQQRAGRWEDAARGYREALEIDPGHEDALYYLGNVEFDLGDYPAAIHAWQRLTEVNPLAGRAYLQLGAIYSCGASGAPFDLDVARASFERALDINKEHTGPVLKLGEVHLLRREDATASAYFEKVLRTDPGSIEANYLRGYLAWRQGDKDLALMSLQRAVAKAAGSKPAPGATGEGETRGSGPMLAEGASRKSFFAPAMAALGSWPGEQVSPEGMEAEYNGLDRRVRDLVDN